MKAYGANKATEFTKKQIGVIFSNAKNGNLKVEKWVMADMYSLAEYYGFDDNGSVEACEIEIMSILSDMFASNVAEAQEKINVYTEKHFNLLSKKAQAGAVRAFI